MATVDASPAALRADESFDPLTAFSLGVLAYICSDLSHEVFGHGVGLFLAGGRSGILTTTRLIFDTQLPDPNWRVFDIGGPAGNLTWACICYLSLRFLRRPAANLRLLLWTSMCFSLFWEAGYLVLCGVKGHGDWMAFVDGVVTPWLWHPLLVLLGYLLFRASVWVGRRGLNSIIPRATSRERLRILMLVCAAGSLIATAGPLLDPRGRLEMLNSGLLSTLTMWLAIVAIARPSPGPLPGEPATAHRSTRSLIFILLALAAAVVYVAVLGPGIPVRL